MSFTINGGRYADNFEHDICPMTNNSRILSRVLESSGLLCAHENNEPETLGVIIKKCVLCEKRIWTFWDVAKCIRCGHHMHGACAAVSNSLRDRMVWSTTTTMQTAEGKPDTLQAVLTEQTTATIGAGHSSHDDGVSCTGESHREMTLTSRESETDRTVEKLGEIVTKLGEIMKNTTNAAAAAAAASVVPEGLTMMATGDAPKEIIRATEPAAEACTPEVSYRNCTWTTENRHTQTPSAGLFFNPRGSPRIFRRLTRGTQTIVDRAVEPTTVCIDDSAMIQSTHPNSADSWRGDPTRDWNLLEEYWRLNETRILADLSKSMPPPPPAVPDCNGDGQENHSTRPNSAESWRGDPTRDWNLLEEYWRLNETRILADLSNSNFQ